MSGRPRQVTRRVRVLAAIAFALALTIPLAVLVGLNDGGWPVPVIAAGLVVVWPIRAIVLLAIACTAAMLVLGLMTVGIFYWFSLALLIFALAEFRARADQATA